MGAIVKQLATLLAGQALGANGKANLIVKSLRIGYTLTGAGILVVWYSAWRNERVEVGKVEFPFPGVTNRKRRFKPDRPEKKIADDTARKSTPREWGTSVGQGAKQERALGEIEGGSTVGFVPQTAQKARKFGGVSHYDGHLVANWIIPYLIYAKTHGWGGHVESGYRSYAEQKRIYDSGVRPAAVPGTSNHEGKDFPRGAVDVTNAAQLSQILQSIPGGSLLKWAGSADPVHFSFPHNGGY